MNESKEPDSTEAMTDNSSYNLQVPEKLWQEGYIRNLSREYDTYNERIVELIALDTACHLRYSHGIIELMTGNGIIDAEVIDTLSTDPEEILSDNSKANNVPNIDIKTDDNEDNG